MVMIDRWRIDIGAVPGNGPRDARRQWRQCATRPMEPTPDELAMLLRRHDATEIRAMSPDGRIEIIWTQASRSRRTFLLTESPGSI